MNRVDRLLSLLDGRGVRFEVAEAHFGSAYEVEEAVRLAKRQAAASRIQIKTLRDGSDWIFRSNRQRDEEQRRARIRMSLEPWLSEGMAVSRNELVSMFRGMPIAPIDEVLMEAGYYCDPDMDREEGLGGEWYRPIGFEMPADVRWMCMRELRVLYSEGGISSEDAWQILQDIPRLEGITRTWFNNCWAVVRNGQQGTLG